MARPKKPGCRVPLTQAALRGFRQWFPSFRGGRDAVVRKLSRLSTRCPGRVFHLSPTERIRIGFICHVRELAGSIVPRPLLVSCPIHLSAVNRTNHGLSPVLLLSKQERRNSKNNQSDKQLHLQFHLILLSLAYFPCWMRQESAPYPSIRTPQISPQGFRFGYRTLGGNSGGASSLAFILAEL